MVMALHPTRETVMTRMTVCILEPVMSGMMESTPIVLATLIMTKTKMAKMPRIMAVPTVMTQTLRFMKVPKTLGTTV